MRKTYLELADRIILQGPTLVVAVAETATALGAGVAQELYWHCPKLYYTQTTRQRLNVDPTFCIQEDHSHAPQHLVYYDEADLATKRISSILIVDDEITTGETLRKLTDEFSRRTPGLKEIIWASLVSWLTQERKREIEDEFPNLKIKFISLLDGQFSFQKTKNFNTNFPLNTASEPSKTKCRSNLGRTGATVKEISKYRFINEAGSYLDVDNISNNNQYAIVGTGEFTFQPFLIAEELERLGYDVLFQSTGRSPIIEGTCINNKIIFFDKRDSSVHYLYNLPDDRSVIVLYETKEQMIASPLHDMLNCESYFLEDV